MNPQFWWYLARGSGIVAWALIAGSVVFGLWVSLRLTRQRPRPAWVLDLHRFLGGLAVIFTGMHLAGLALDSYVDFGLVELLVPFQSTWKPDAVAIGVIGLYVLLAIELTSLAMRRLPRKWWRAVHFTSYPLYVIATVHLFSAGTDAGSGALQVTALAATVLIVFFTVARVLADRRVRPNRDRVGSTARHGRSTARPAPTASSVHAA